jgi:GT2 family glycosyltransferase
MIGIVMAYYNRNEQLIKTLQSFAESAYMDFEVIIVDDCSPKDIKLPEFPFDITILKLRDKRDKTWNNSSIVFNIGFARALKNNPDIIMIHNPECYHVGDVISFASKVTDDNYISFGCFKLNKGTEGNLNELIEKNNVCAKCDPDGVWRQSCAWVNHPVIDPVGFHYCSAITAKNLIKINGFDERFWEGISYEDDYLVRQIKNLGLRIDITETPFVVHQWHESEQTIKENPELWEINRKVLYDIIPENSYKAKHCLTPDLCGI